MAIEDIVALQFDEALYRYVAAWPRIPRAGNGSPNHEQAARMLGIPQGLAQLAHERAVHFALILPDGRLADHALQYVRARVATELGLKRAAQGRANR